MNSTYRLMSDWERERWQEIVHVCTSRPGGVEFGPQAKAVILAVARELEEVEERNRGLLAACKAASDRLTCLYYRDVPSKEITRQEKERGHA